MTLGNNPLVRRFVKLVSIIGLCIVAAWLIVFIAFERVRTVSGICPDYACMADVLKRQGGSIHDGALSQVPMNAHDISYFFFAHIGEVEIVFPFAEDKFIAWAESLGWTPNLIAQSHLGGTIGLEGPHDGRGPRLVEFGKGYQLWSVGPRNNLCRAIAYDEESHTVYLKVTTPLPEHIRNESTIFSTDERKEKGDPVAP